MKKIFIPKELKKLARFFHRKSATLYIVGGYIRQYFLDDNLQNQDIDVCSKLTTNEVKKIIGKKFKTKIINKELGTMLIYYKNFKCEYTCFRKEKYQKGGYHCPTDVEFVSELEIDAQRRDFTMNTIYYDILNKEFIDKYNGIEDINNRLIKTISIPEYVFSRDGLRILRMIRFAGILNFEIDYNTFSVSKQYRNQLADITYERINAEMTKIINSKYCNLSLYYISKLNLWKYIIFNNLVYSKNELEYWKPLQNTNCNKKIIFGVLLLKKLVEYFDKNPNDKTSEENANNVLNNIKLFSKKDKNEILLVNNKLNQTEINIDSINFIIDNQDIIEEIICLTKNNELKLKYNEMLSFNLPIKLNQLSVNGKDVINNTNLKGKSISKALLKLQKYSLINHTNDRIILLDILKKNTKGEKV